MGIACVLSMWRDTDQGTFVQLGILHRNTSILLSSVGGVLGQESAFKAGSSWGRQVPRTDSCSLPVKRHIGSVRRN